MSLVERRILLGVAGGIAAYKTCELARRLRQAGADVQVVMTANAEHFVGAASFQALTGRAVRGSLWDAQAEAAMGHIELARWADAIVIAPASADLLARLAHGRADDLLTTLCLASAAPLWLAPAMNQQMWAHPATRANVELLVMRGTRLLGPASGEQACGDVGAGRMFEPDAILAALQQGFGDAILAGRKVLVSAGPTLEDIDPVRFLGNRSSGRMGFAVAEAAAAAGAQTVLVAGPVALATPPGVVRRINVRSAAEMHDAMLAEARGADIVIAAAAVADYRPRTMAESKLKKSPSGAVPELDLVENPDIVAALGRLEPRPFLVGFAAETENVEANARGKLERKKLDMIAANQVGGGLGFDVADNALTVLWRDGVRELGQASKAELARQLLALVREHYERRHGASA